MVRWGEEVWFRLWCFVGELVGGLSMVGGVFCGFFLGDKGLVVFLSFGVVWVWVLWV